MSKLKATNSMELKISQRRLPSFLYEVPLSKSWDIFLMIPIENVHLRGRRKDGWKSNSIWLWIWWSRALGMQQIVLYQSRRIFTRTSLHIRSTKIPLIQAHNACNLVFAKKTIFPKTSRPRHEHMQQDSLIYTARLMFHLIYVDHS